MATEVLQLTANIAILLIGITLLAFIILYGAFFNWRKTAGGRSVMYLLGSLELLVLLAAFLSWTDFLHRETEQLLRVEAYLIVYAAVTRMLYVLVTRWGVRQQEFEVPPRRRPQT